MHGHIRTAAILAMTSVLGHAQMSYGQDNLPNTIEENLFSIAPKGCALFVWINNSKAPRLITTTTHSFGFNSRNEATKLRRLFSSKADALGQFSRQDFDDGTGRQYQLHLGPALTATDTILYETGTWTLQNEDGWLQVESAKAVSACNPATEVTQIRYDELSAGFHPPNWLRTPIDIQSEISTPEIIQELKVVQNIIEAETPLAKVSPVEPLIYDALVPPNDAVIKVDPKPFERADIIGIIPSLYTVQIGAFKKPEQAVTHLYKLRNKLSYLDDLDYALQETTVENVGQLYRLRLTSIPNKSSAIKLCTRLKGDGVDCFVP